MGAACPSDAAKLGDEEDDAGPVTLGDAFARYRSQRPQREPEVIEESSEPEPPQMTPAQALDEHDARHRRWRAEKARKKKEEEGLTEEETAEELEHLIHRVMMQKVSLESTGHQNDFLESMDGHGHLNPDDFVLTDVASLMTNLDKQNRRLETLSEAHRMGDYKHDEQIYEADGEHLPEEDGLCELVHYDDDRADGDQADDDRAEEDEEWFPRGPSSGDPEDLDDADKARLDKGLMKNCSTTEIKRACNTNCVHQ